MKEILFLSIILITATSCVHVNKPSEINTDNSVRIVTNTEVKIDTIPLFFVQSIGAMNNCINGKWYLYCIYCDDTILFTHQDKITDTTTYGDLKLKLCRIESHRDTIAFTYCFFYHDSIPCLQNIVKNFPISSVLFKYTDSIPCQFLWAGELMWDVSPHTRMGYPTQPDMIEYVRENRAKLDPWFVDEAKKRGIFDSVKYPPNDFSKHSTRIH
jgi:hypothetical protein